MAKAPNFSNLFYKNEAVKTTNKFIDVFDEFVFEEFNSESKFNINANGGAERRFRPSNIHKNYHCPRKLVYEYIGAESQIEKRAHSAQTHMIFENGHGVHSRLQKIIAQMSRKPHTKVVLLGRWRCKMCGSVFGELDPQPDQCTRCGCEYFKYAEVMVKIPEFKISGQCDGVVDWEGERWLLELKSMNPFTFAKTKQVPPDYLPQANFYMMGTGIHQQLFILEDKATQSKTEFHIAHDPKIIKPHLEAVKEACLAIEAKRFPKVLSDPEEVKLRCRACEYSKVCKQDKPFEYDLRIAV